MVEGGAKLGPFGNGDGVLGATLVVSKLGRLDTVVFLPVARWSVIASVLRGMLGGVVLGLVPAMGSLGILHVGMLVDDRHHVANSFGVALEHLPP